MTGMEETTVRAQKGALGLLFVAILRVPICSLTVVFAVSNFPSISNEVGIVGNGSNARSGEKECLGANKHPLAIPSSNFALRGEGGVPHSIISNTSNEVGNVKNGGNRPKGANDYPLATGTSNFALRGEGGVPHCIRSNTSNEG